VASPDYQSLSDQELVSAANAGDATAFEALYERYRDWVFTLALRFTHDHALAHDVLQDTFIYFLGKFPGFTLTAQLKTFLYPVVRHNALALRRKHKSLTLHNDSETLAQVQTPHHTSRPPESLHELQAAIAGLDSAHREVVILRFVEDLSLAEIALAMEIPLGTVKSRLHHALAELRANERLRTFFEQP
jgi:RNA polymerase sigma-70 factor, ECF subfamily